MDYSEMMKKTGMRIVGVLKSVNEYVAKNGVTYYSIDVDVEGTRGPINISLPTSYDRKPLVPYQLVQTDCVVVPSFDRKGIIIRAVGK